MEATKTQKSRRVRRVRRKRTKRNLDNLRSVRRVRIRRYRSGLEDKVIADLEQRGIKYEYEPITFDYPHRIRRAKCGSCGSVDVVQSRRYTPDLRIGHFFVEIKGKLTSEIRTRMEEFHRGHPDIDLRFLFQRDNWLTKAHKTKYSDWAGKLGFQYTVGEIVPKEWVDGQ